MLLLIHCGYGLGQDAIEVLFGIETLSAQSSGLAMGSSVASSSVSRFKTPDGLGVGIHLWSIAFGDEGAISSLY
jgi:hypothetical protein